jgi:NAD(P)H-hydrate epimerase
MKIFPTNIIKKLDQCTIEREGIGSLDLMERAAAAITAAITKRWDVSTPFTVFAGPGNNGGDALAVARMLAEKGYRVEVYLFNTKGSLSPDCEANKELVEMMSEVAFHEVTSQFTPPVLTDEHVVVDGLFGSGLNKPLAGGFAAVVKYINSSPASVVSIDIPSGLMGEDNTYNIRANIVRADLTLSLQMPKLAFFFAENAEALGEWDVLDIGIDADAIEETDTCYELLEPEDVRYLLKVRSRFDHKGVFGHALLVAGSRGMAGASVLAARACLRSGVGLLTVHAPECNNVVLQCSVPEAMVSIDDNDRCFAVAPDTDPYNAVAVGPGLGRSEESEMALISMIHDCQSPMVIDADAINILANHRPVLNSLPKGSILTPHPKELERLVGHCQSSFDRMSKAAELARTAGVYIVLKGAFTTIITPTSSYFFNPTGNPGMATAGSGDVLTGVILALLAQGYSSEEACKLGVFVHGLAGDFAKRKLGEVSMTSGDIVKYLSSAFNALSK